MKQAFLIIFLFSLLDTFVSAKDFHLLSDNKGREVEAKITYYSPSSDKVVVELRTGKRVTVSASRFDEKSQCIIQGWNQENLHANGKLLNIDFKCNLVNSWKQKEQHSFTDKEGASYDSETVLNHNRYSYDIRVSNLSSSQISLTNLACSVLIERNRSTGDKYETYDIALSGNPIPGKQSTLYTTKPVFLIMWSKYPRIAGARIKGEIITASGFAIPFTIYETEDLEKDIKELPHIEKYDPPGSED